MVLYLEPLYIREGADDLAFYQILVLWTYSSLLGVLPIPYMDGSPNPVVYKWWEASLN